MSDSSNTNASGLSETNRPLVLAGADLWDVPLLLLLGAVQSHRLTAGERCNPPDPGQSGEVARELARQNHLRDDVATLPAVLLGNPDTVETRGAKLVPELEGEVGLMFLPLQRG